MFHSRIRLIVAATALALLTLVPAAVARTVNYTSKVQSVPLSTANGYPAPGGTAVLVGTLRTTLGSGALVDRITVTGQPQPNVFTFKGTEVALFPDGSVRDRFTGSATVQSDGSQKLVAKGRITGGTGRYRGATGTFTFNGTVASGSTRTIGGSKGTLVLSSAATRAAGGDTAAAPQLTPAPGVRYAPGITTRNGHFVYYDVADPSRTYRPAAHVQLAKGWVIRNGRLERVR